MMNDCIESSRDGSIYDHICCMMGDCIVPVTASVSAQSYCSHRRNHWKNYVNTGLQCIMTRIPMQA